MNDQTGIGASAFYCIENFVERNDYEIEFAEEKLKCQKRAGHFAGNSNRYAAQQIASIAFVIVV